jgi:hypothetical protein
VRRARPSWRTLLAVALGALPLTGLSLVAAGGAAGETPVAPATVVQRVAAPPAPVPAVRPARGTPHPARAAAAARTIGLFAVLLAGAVVVVVATPGGRLLPVPTGVGRPGRRVRAAGRGPPVLPR